MEFPGFFLCTKACTEGGIVQPGFSFCSFQPRTLAQNHTEMSHQFQILNTFNSALHPSGSTVLNHLLVFGLTYF